MLEGWMAKARRLFEPRAELRADAAPADAAFREALALHQQGRLDEAADRYRKTLVLDAHHAPALNFLGLVACQQGDAERAVALIGKAIELDPGQPGFFSNLGLALHETGRRAEAVAACDRALALDPQCVEAYSNRGNSLWNLGRREEALASYASALAIQPDHAQTHWNEGFLRMQLGQFESGWQKQEWRWKLERTRGDWRDFAAPRWLGKEDLAGKTLLLHAEQGLGDTIQFCRYAKLAAARGARVVLEVQKPLKGLLAGVEGASVVLARGEPLPAFDFHCPLLSLPLAFGTTLQTIPAERAYLRCDPAALDEWHEKIGPRTRPRIGLVWKAAGAHKSLALSDLLALVTPGMEFFSLQNEVSAEDQALLDAKGVRQLTAGLRNFADAPLAALMDVVVTVDTSMAHLAAALGRPVWMFLPHNPEWRWLLEREDSPWYLTMRLLRQDSPGDWSGAIARARDGLAKLA